MRSARHKNVLSWNTRTSPRSRGSYRTVTSSPTYAARTGEMYWVDAKRSPSRCTRWPEGRSQQEGIDVFRVGGHSRDEALTPPACVRASPVAECVRSLYSLTMNRSSTSSCERSGWVR